MISYGSLTLPAVSLVYLILRLLHYELRRAMGSELEPSCLKICPEVGAEPKSLHRELCHKTGAKFEPSSTNESCVGPSFLDRRLFEVCVTFDLACLMTSRTSGPKDLKNAYL